MQPRAEKYKLTEDEITDLLSKGEVVTIGTVGPDGPYVVPVNYVYWNEKIYFHSRKTGRKLDNIAADPRVSLTVYTVSGYFRGPSACATSTLYRSVMGQGLAKVIEGETAEKALLQMAARFNPAVVNPSIPAEKLAMTAVVEITVAQWTGKYCRH
ncbi:MAG: pyridoxamine 5'-phosphate oxidase family protein [Deltaproteobacteria bacterium]|jgi:nitroimidazol reductase NimA-like FMN-containing flavoprotein (pyridoxamine 5'-phosphate oxidase superfamily)|nr:pyridoxamine 5'-phosphate oxidase family protein [Deltaproteobacteria bacterium]